MIVKKICLNILKYHTYSTLNKILSKKEVIKDALIEAGTFFQTNTPTKRMIFRIRKIFIIVISVKAFVKYSITGNLLQEMLLVSSKDQHISRIQSFLGLTFRIQGQPLYYWLPYLS